MFELDEKKFPIDQLIKGGMIGGYGTNGSKLRPWNYDLAVRKLNSWIYRAVMLNANSFANQKLKLYVRNKKGKMLFETRKLSLAQRAYLSGDTKNSPSNSVMTKLAEWSSNDWVEVVEPHPALTLRSRPNKEMSGFQFSQLEAIYLQMTGNSYEIPVIDETLGRPVATYMVPSQWVEVVPSSSNEDAEFYIKGYSVGKAQKTFFPREQIIHNMNPNPTDDCFYYGYAPLQALWSALGLHEAKREEDIARKDNYSRPDYLIGSRTPVDQAQMDRFAADLKKQVRGVKKAGNFVATGFDFRIEALNLPEETLGDPDRLVEEIASVMGVPVSKLLANHGLAGGQAESGDLNHLRDTILPMLRQSEEVLNNSWLTKFEDLDPDDTCLAYDSPIPNENEFQLKKTLELYKAGIISLEHAQKDMGIEPHDVARTETESDPSIVQE